MKTATRKRNPSRQVTKCARSPSTIADDHVIWYHVINKCHDHSFPLFFTSTIPATTPSNMAFWKNKDKSIIPPVQSELAPPSGASRSSSRSTSSLPSYRSNASTYVPSRDGLDPYNNMVKSKSQSEVVDYEPSVETSTGDAQSHLDLARGELFAGYNPQKAGSGRFFDGPAIAREPPPGEENEEDVEGIKQQTRFFKKESVNSTRNALQMAREAEETARGTLGRLADQSGAPKKIGTQLG